MDKIKQKIVTVRTNKFWRNLFKNSFWAFLGDTGSSLIVLAVTVLLIHQIGDDSYGIIVLAETYMYIMDVIFNLQSWKSTIQYGQKALTNKKPQQLRSYVKLGAIVDVGTAIVGGALAVIVTPVVGMIFGWQPELIFCARIMSIEIFFHLSGTSTAILRIMDKFNLVAIQKIIASVIKIVSLLVLLCVMEEKNICNVAWVYCLSDILGNILLVVFAMTVYGKKYGIKKTIKAKIPNDSRKFVSFTIWSTIEGIADIPVSQLDVFIVSLLGNQSVAIFKVYKQIVNILRKVTSPIQQSIMPQFSELSAKGKQKEGYAIVIKIRNVILKVCLPISLLLGVTSPVWLNIIYGEAYAAEWYSLLTFLIIQTFALSYTTIHPFYLSLGKPKSSALILVFANIVYAVIAYLLIGKIGLMAMMVAYAVQCFTCVYLKIAGAKKTIAGLGESAG